MNRDDLYALAVGIIIIIAIALPILAEAHQPAPAEVQAEATYSVLGGPTGTLYITEWRAATEPGRLEQRHRLRRRCIAATTSQRGNRLVMMECL